LFGFGQCWSSAVISNGSCPQIGHAKIEKQICLLFHQSSRNQIKNKIVRASRNKKKFNCDRIFFLISGSSKNVVIDFGQEIQLLNDKIDCLD